MTGTTGRVLGVAAADITLARLREMMLQNVNASRAVTNRYLVDEGGRIIIGSGSGPEDETAPEDGGFRQFPNPELLRTIRDRRNGGCSSPKTVCAGSISSRRSRRSAGCISNGLTLRRCSAANIKQPTNYRISYE